MRFTGTTDSQRTNIEDIQIEHCIHKIVDMVITGGMDQPLDQEDSNMSIYNFEYHHRIAFSKQWRTCDFFWAEGATLTIS